MSIKRNLIAHLGFVVVNPGICRVGQDLALKIRLYVLIERHIFGISQFAIGLGFALQLAFGVQHNRALVIPQGSLNCNGAIAKRCGFE